jgi:hypothetical protein
MHACAAACKISFLHAGSPEMVSDGIPAKRGNVPLNSIQSSTSIRKSNTRSPILHYLTPRQEAKHPQTVLHFHANDIPFEALKNASPGATVCGLPNEATAMEKNDDWNVRGDGIHEREFRA